MKLDSRFLLISLLAWANSQAQTNTFPTSGNVGIGTTTPSQKLHLSGSEPLFLLQDTNAGGKAYSFGSRWGGYFTFTDEGAAQVLFSAKDGNLALGTLTPEEKIHLHGNTMVVGNLRVRGENYIGSVYNSTYNDYWLAFMSGQQTNAGILHIRTGDDGDEPIYLEQGTNVRLAVANNGNIGIGTTNPQAKLDINGNAIVSSLLTVTGSIETGAHLELTTKATGNRYSYIDLHGDDSYTDFSTRLIRNNSGPNADAGLEHRGTGGLFLRTWESAPILLVTANAERLRVAANGNVAIGTTNATHKLTVNGTIRAKEVIVDTGWSDYVFASDYRLAPLNEVEQQIKENKHLPGIPSAKEVAEQGISLGEMQAKLLAKIEELTLHVIAQEKQIQNNNKMHQEEMQKLRAEIDVVKTAR